MPDMPNIDPPIGDTVLSPNTDQTIQTGGGERTAALAAESKALTTADAKSRSLRTLLQGLALDLLVAAGSAGLLVVGTLDSSQLLTTAAWVALGTAVAKSVLTAGLSYLTRLALPPAE